MSFNGRDKPTDAQVAKLAQELKDKLDAAKPKAEVIDINKKKKK